MKLTDQQLAELKALADAATPGPWWSGECVPADGHALAWLGNMFVDCNGGQKNYAEPSCDAEFIAASREAIPALIAGLEEANAHLASSQASVRTLDDFVKMLENERDYAREQLAKAQARNSVLSNAIGFAKRALDLQLARPPSTVMKAEYQIEVMKEAGRVVRAALCVEPTDALDAAIAEALEPYRKETERLREALVRIAEFERQQGLLVDALEEYVGNDTAPAELNCILQKAMAALAAVKPVTMLNGLTEAETSASASVAGLMLQQQWIAKPTVDQQKG
jgi:hypothetical protein